MDCTWYLSCRGRRNICRSRRHISRVDRKAHQAANRIRSCGWSKQWVAVFRLRF